MVWAMNCGPKRWTQPLTRNGEASMGTEQTDQIGPVKINGMTYMRPIVRVAHVTFDGSTMVVPADELLDHIGDDEQNTYQVRFSTMRRTEFEALPEFAGF